MFAQARGTRSIRGEELRQRNYIKKLLVQWARNNNFSEIELPTFEYSDLFVGSSEQEENILEKEIFFLEGKKYALKPEGTISIAREIVNQKMIAREVSPLKFCYLTQCYRYERPQKGRYREFTQFGVEIVNANSVFFEIELILSLNKFLNSVLGLTPHLRINYLASSEIKKKWAEELRTYFSDPENSAKLSKISRDRIRENPIRILDDKNDSHLQVVKDSPKIHNYFSEEDKKNVETIKKYLNCLGVKYQWDNNLVRGLDYYTGIVFEWEINNLTIAGGGRYNELFNKFQTGTTPKNTIPSLGLAVGIDRLHLALNENNYKWPRKISYKLYLCNLMVNIEPKVILLVQKLKEEGIQVETNWEFKDLNSHFKYSDKLGFRWLLIYGEKEHNNREIILKEQNKNYQIYFSLDNLEVLIEEVKRTLEFE
ncbi:histidine--tRNA ligase [Mycoplasma suis]|uniref:Histidine--tRNA ligase n=2 Tax=Mycoplasma suis TaxID=57372 RepID=F0QQY3_MYCSL|nr:histidine--tRNA ligase [Mycoplasma suis]ADX97903.1 histidyl-tRNA synthetase [Mycoplasma suis str. Illinois]CBZ40403.1 Histidyl-tRNA synthetase [Mycoplasma suis KI3806]